MPDSAKQPSQSPQADLPPEATNNRRVRAFRASGEIKIDGRLDESDWQKVEIVGDLRQQEPTEGAAATGTYRRERVINPHKQLPKP